MRKEPRGQTYVVNMNGEQRIHVENLKPFIASPVGETKQFVYKTPKGILETTDELEEERQVTLRVIKRRVDEYGNEVYE